MSWSHTIDAFDLLDRPDASGPAVVDLWRSHGGQDIVSMTEDGPGGSTDFVRAVIPGLHGKRAGGPAPTLGVVGRLGGLGARPAQVGFVSDGDGALTVVAAAAKLFAMARAGDRLAGDVIVTTHIDPDAPTQPHEPVPFMGSSVEAVVNDRHEVLPEMDAVLSVDTTKGNRLCNHRGFALTPTVRAGWILRVSENLLDIAAYTSGRPPVTIPITMQDITPYGNGVYHMNSILQPAVATGAPVVGVAITAESAVPGSSTGATDLSSVEATVRFVIEVAKAYGQGRANFVDADYDRLVEMYGPMTSLQQRTTNNLTP